MPRQDGTGPMGQGPLTGRGMGSCGQGAGYGRFGRRMGRGRGFGRAIGMGDRSYIPVQEVDLEDEKKMLQEELSAIDEEIKARKNAQK